MEISYGSIALGFFSSLFLVFVGAYINHIFSRRAAKKDKLDDFKDKTIADVATMGTKIEVLTNGLSKLEGKLEQNTDVMTKHVAVMDHISRQLKRLFEHNGLRVPDKEVSSG
jgi:hypothetical protein